MEFDLYKDIQKRTNGEIYIGVVGPVRTGKSTFIKRFMDLFVLPYIEDEEEKKRLSILADAGEELQKYKFEYDKLDSEKRSYDSCLLTEEEIKKEQKQIDGWQEEIIRKETQQKEELEQQKKDKALLDSAELELQKAETKKTEGLRKKKELEGLIALVKEFQGAYNAHERAAGKI